MLCYSKLCYAAMICYAIKVVFLKQQMHIIIDREQTFFLKTCNSTTNSVFPMLIF